MPRRTRAGRGRPRGQGGLQASRALKSVPTCAVAHETRAAFPPPTRTRGHGGLAHSHARTCWPGTCANARAVRMPGRARGVCMLVTHPPPREAPARRLSAPRWTSGGCVGGGSSFPFRMPREAARPPLPWTHQAPRPPFTPRLHRVVNQLKRSCPSTCSSNS